MTDYNEQPLNPIWDNPDMIQFTKATMVGSLPVRGEKRIIPVELDMGLTKTARAAAESAAIDANPDVQTQEEADKVTSDAAGKVPTYEAISFAKNTLTDYMTIRLPHRPSDVDVCYTYRFLVNPKTIQISRQTADAHSMTRAGWQFGIWGEDTIDLHVQGMTAGNYFEAGLTDRWSEFSLSYRNLMELVNLFENNGYWFEGEETNQQWKAPDYARKRIKTHGDVEIRVGNFIWSGMFVNMTVTNNAELPFLSTFDFNFLAWKERYLPASPWINMIENSVYRGHSMEATRASRDARDAAASLAARASDQAGYAAAADASAGLVPNAATALPNNTNPASASSQLPIPAGVASILAASPAVYVPGKIGGF